MNSFLFPQIDISPLISFQVKIKMFVVSVLFLTQMLMLIAFNI